jgi:hypothetical protein
LFLSKMEKEMLVLSSHRKLNSNKSEIRFLST